jgi:hypothetical protein
MFRKRFWWKALVALIVVGLFAAASAGTYRLGWFQGYAAGQATGEGVETEARPYLGLPHHFGFPQARRYPGLSPFGFAGHGLLRVGALLLVMLLVLGFLGRSARRIACGPEDARWAGHGHWHWHGHGPHPGEGAPFEAKVKPDAGSGGNVDEE